MAIDTILPKVRDTIQFCLQFCLYYPASLLCCAHFPSPQPTHLSASFVVHLCLYHHSFTFLHVIIRHISLDEILAHILSFFCLLYIVLKSKMKTAASPLLHAEINNYVAAHDVGCRQNPSFSELDLSDPDLQSESKNGTATNINETRRSAFDRFCITEQIAVAEQQTANLLPTEDEIRNSCSSDRVYHSAISSDHPSPCTVCSGFENAAAYTHSSDPSSNISSDGFSPNLWNMSPEERSLMTNSANFARGRRRRGAIQYDVSLELNVSSLSSAAQPSPPVLSPGLDSSDGDSVRVSEDLSVCNDNIATPRGRLQRSFTPSERDDAGVILVPGLLRRLGRPFSGPWRGPLSPLTPVSLVAAPPVGRLSCLRRFFSRRR